jgi:Transposase
LNQPEGGTMEQIHDRVAGLDVHRDSVAVCARVPGKRRGVATHKQRFATTTGGLAQLAAWLRGHAVTVVGMEATGVYWKPVYYALEDWFEVWLCNAHHVPDGPVRRSGRVARRGSRDQPHLGRGDHRRDGRRHGPVPEPGAVATSAAAQRHGSGRRGSPRTLVQSACPEPNNPPSGGQDLWASTRTSPSDPWSCPTNLGFEVNTAVNDIQAHLADDAETLYYSGNGPDGTTMDDIWLIRRDRLDDE